MNQFWLKVCAVSPLSLPERRIAMFFSVPDSALRCATGSVRAVHHAQRVEQRRAQILGRSSSTPSTRAMARSARGGVARVDTPL